MTLVRGKEPGTKSLGQSKEPVPTQHGLVGDGGSISSDDVHAQTMGPPPSPASPAPQASLPHSPLFLSTQVQTLPEPLQTLTLWIELAVFFQYVQPSCFFTSFFKKKMHIIEKIETPQKVIRRDRIGQNVGRKKVCVFP